MNLFHLWRPGRRRPVQPSPRAILLLLLIQNSCCQNLFLDFRVQFLEQFLTTVRRDQSVRERWQCCCALDPTEGFNLDERKMNEFVLDEWKRTIIPFLFETLMLMFVAKIVIERSWDIAPFDLPSSSSRPMSSATAARRLRIRTPCYSQRHQFSRQ